MTEKPSIIGTTEIKRVRLGGISTPYKLPPIPAYVSRLLIAQRDADVEWYGDKCNWNWASERWKVEQARTEVARDIGEGLCILIGNLMIENQEAGNKLGDQLESFIKHQIKGKWLKGGE